MTTTTRPVYKPAHHRQAVVNSSEYNTKQVSTLVEDQVQNKRKKINM